MIFEVGKIIRLGWKLAGYLPTFQPLAWHFQLCVCDNFRLAVLPTSLPTFQPAVSGSDPCFSRLEVGKIFPSYREVCPGLMPGTPRLLSQVSLNHQQQEKSAWAD